VFTVRSHEPADEVGRVHRRARSFLDSSFFVLDEKQL
jgi:hypothetical protein